MDSAPRPYSVIYRQVRSVPLRRKPRFHRGRRVCRPRGIMSRSSESDALNQMLTVRVVRLRDLAAVGYPPHCMKS